MPPGATTLPPDTTPALGLTLRPLTALPQPVPTGFTAVAAAEVYPVDLHFSQPARLTLPLATPMPPGQLSILLHFNTTTQTYEQVGLARQCRRYPHHQHQRWAAATVHRAVCHHRSAGHQGVSGAGGGNNQRVQPGEVLPSH